LQEGFSCENGWYIFFLSGRCLWLGGVGFAELFAFRACMETIWNLILIGLHAGSVMGVRLRVGGCDIIFQASNNAGFANSAVEHLLMMMASSGVIMQAW
jgi:hypothetical protein